MSAVIAIYWLRIIVVSHVFFDNGGQYFFFKMDNQLNRKTLEANVDEELLPIFKVNVTRFDFNCTINSYFFKLENKPIAKPL